MIYPIVQQIYGDSALAFMASTGAITIILALLAVALLYLHDHHITHFTFVAIRKVLKWILFVSLGIFVTSLLTLGACLLILKS